MLNNKKEALATLKLGDNPSEKDIKKAYYELALKHHPDKWSEEDQDRYKILSEKTKDGKELNEQEQKELKEYIKKGEEFKKISAAHSLLTGKTEEFRDEYSWQNFANEFTKAMFGSHLSELEGALFNALILKDLKKVQVLLPQIENLNIKIKPGSGAIEDRAPLHYIVENACTNPNQGWEKLLEEVLLKNNSKSSTNSIEIVNTQLIDIDISNQVGNTPLHTASSHGRVDLIETLRKYGADVNKLNSLNSNPLHNAAHGKHLQAVELLLKYNAKISNGEKVIFCNTILYSIATNKYSSEITAVLLGHASTEEKNEIFIESCEKGEVTIISDLLLKYKVNPNLISVDECATILQEVCQLSKSRPNSTKVVRLLLDAGADPVLEVGKWPNALNIAKNGNNTELIELLSEYANKNTESQVQHTTAPQQLKTKPSPKNRFKYAIVGTVLLTIGIGLAIAATYTKSPILIAGAVLSVLAVTAVFCTYKYNSYGQNSNLTTSITEQPTTSMPQHSF